MPISFACQKCGKAVTAHDQLAGKPATCPECNSVVTVPLQTELHTPDSAAAGDNRKGQAISLVALFLSIPLTLTGVALTFLGLNNPLGLVMGLPILVASRPKTVQTRSSWTGPISRQ
jgi:hypothetical protein